LETLQDYDTGGITTPLTFSSSDHAGSKALELNQVQGGSWIAISDYIFVGE
jgi:branched-chain amino acid transport system substrate-binding protein